MSSVHHVIVLRAEFCLFVFEIMGYQIVMHLAGRRWVSLVDTTGLCASDVSHKQLNQVVKELEATQRRGG